MPLVPRNLDLGGTLLAKYNLGSTRVDNWYRMHILMLWFCRTYFCGFRIGCVVLALQVRK